ncbi:MAG: phage protein NinX family protein [Pseudomonadota bacterium]
MKASELEGRTLDEWVAKARGIALSTDNDGSPCYDPGHNLPPRKWNPSRYWSQGGPLIEAYRIDINWNTEGTEEWAASCEPDILAHGKSVLEAAMRAVVMARFGEALDG